MTIDRDIDYNTNSSSYVDTIMRELIEPLAKRARSENVCITFRIYQDYSEIEIEPHESFRPVCPYKD